ncbi:MAG: NHL repeat-containing protein [bacterium]
MAIAPDKTVFAADHSAGRVYRFTPGGRLMPAWEAEVGPLAMAPNGDIYASTGRRIQRYDVSGNLRGEWGSYGTGEGEFRLPLDLSVGPDGTVYVLDSGFGGVQYFTPEGSFLGRWGPDGFKYGRYKNPRGIAAGPDGKVYVLENSAVGANYRFDYFTATGSFLGSYDLPDNYSTAYGSGIAVASDGTVYISDRGDERIHYYEPSRVFHVIRYVVFSVTVLIIAFLITLIARRLLKRRKGTATL